MYNAVMKYNFKPERLKEAVGIWKTGVADKIAKQPGFIRVQFYTKENGEALAIGTWESKDDADRFMKTGVFADIIKTFGDCMSDQPRGGDYTLEYFEEA
ncbi:antibiotic biosynthesis monooxygenase family protein [Fusibacter sp. JL216-2]|uniref:antibiotic biosynthesis monooxygenase family protein n=1 Tax=Fusibacter sp. JL216-2 TaxID=3071453 RepID=UPI003D34FFB6